MASAPVVAVPARQRAATVEPSHAAEEAKAQGPPIRLRTDLRAIRCTRTRAAGGQLDS